MAKIASIMSPKIKPVKLPKVKKQKSQNPDTIIGGATSTTDNPIATGPSQAYKDLHSRFTDLGYENADAHRLASLVIGWRNKKQ